MPGNRAGLLSAFSPRITSTRSGRIFAQGRIVLYNMDKLFFRRKPRGPWRMGEGNMSCKVAILMENDFHDI
ncbi:MAG TPA: hypothetical protein DCE03_00110, partial [Synergistaceae bacterium]|nr:hypothetical protein [Synergistaceae bacterium]